MALLAILAASAAFAQPEKLKFDRLSLDQGLSQASGNAILQDRQGLLWIGTQDGLNLWDGYEVEIFKRDPDDEASLADNFISNLYADREGRLWVLHGSGGALTLLDPLRRTFRRLVHDPDDPASLGGAARQLNGRAIFEDEQGRIWLGTFGGGIDVVDKATLTVEHLRPEDDDPESLAHDEVNVLFEAADGTLWIGTDAGLQRRRPPAADRRERFFTYRHDADDPASLSPGEVNNVVEAADGRLWVGTSRGLSRLDPETGSCERFLEGED